MHQHDQGTRNSSTQSEMLERMRRIERQLSRTRIGLALSVCAGIGLMLMAAGAVERVTRGLPTLRVSGLIVVDENDKDRMTLKINDQGEAEFKVLDAQGNDTFHAP